MTHSLFPVVAWLLCLSVGATAQFAPNYLAAPSYYSTPANWQSYLTAGDLNQDGRDDIVRTAFASFSVSLSTPSGQIGAPVNYYCDYASSSTTMSQYSPIIGDFTRDGLMDIAFLGITDYPPSVAVLYRQNTTGAFTLQQILPIPLALGIYAADIDNDGFPELISLRTRYSPYTNSYTATAITVHSSASGSLTASLVYGTTRLLNGMVLADISGDGLLDFVLLEYNAFGQPTNVFIVMWLGVTNSFGPSWTLPLPGILPLSVISATCLRAADVDQNGSADIILTVDPNATFPIQTFVPIVATCTTPLSGGGWWTMAVPEFMRGGPTTVLPEDVNRDGSIDLIGTRNEYMVSMTPPFSTTYNSRVFALIGTANGQFLPPMSYALPFPSPIASPGRIGATAVADLDGDGDRELVFVDTLMSQVGVAHNRARFGSPFGATSTFNPLIATGLPTLGNTAFSVSLSGAPPNAPALLALSYATNPAGSASPILVDLAASTLMLPLASGLTQTSALGSASIQLPIPANPMLFNTVAFGQWGVLNPLPPGGLLLSAGATMIIQ